MGLKEDLAEAQRLGESISTLSKKMRALMDDLESRIYMGESSGDKILDFCIGCYGQLGFVPDVQMPYRELADFLNNRTGQGVLCIYSNKHQENVDIKLWLGTLSEKLGFDTANNRLVFPCTSHFFSQHKYSGSTEEVFHKKHECQTIQGPIQIHYLNMPHLAGHYTKMIGIREYMHYVDSKILVGESIMNFLARLHEINSSQQAVNLLREEEKAPEEV